MITLLRLFPSRFYRLLLICGICCIASNKLSAQNTKIGFMLSSLNSDRWYKDKDAFQEKAAALGARVITTNAEDKPEKQTEQVEELIKEGVNILVVIPVDGKRASAIVEQAHKANIKVIAYDRLIKDCDLDFYVSYNNNKVGEIMAKFALKEKPQGNYAIINGPESDNNVKQINEGMHSVLDASIQSGSIKLLEEKATEQWSEIEAMMITQDLIQKHKSIDAILTSADLLALGAVNALEEANMLGKTIVTGQDADLQACKHILAGNQQMTIYKPIAPLAAKAAELAVLLANGKMAEKNATSDNGKIAVPSYLIEPILVTKENMKAAVIDPGHWKAEDLEK